MTNLIKIVDQTSKNIHDIRKICLETTLCILACFIQCYLLVLDEIDVRGRKLRYEYISIINVKVQVSTEKTNGP